MAFKKIELVFLLILLQFFLLLPLDANSSATADFIQPLNATDTKLGGDREMTAKLTRSKHIVSVERRGSGGGGRGGGGHAFGGSHGGGGRAIGGRGAGGRSNQGRRGPNLIPFYAAGAMPHHQNNQQHRSGSGQGNRSTVGPPSLLLLIQFLLCII